jgi:hypothetical protein
MYPGTQYFQLGRSLYGIRQAASEFNNKATDEIQRAGFTRSKLDPCLFWRKEKSNEISLLGIHVDDLLSAGREEDLRDTRKELNQTLLVKLVRQDRQVLRSDGSS